MLTVQWNGCMGFEALPPSGNRFLMDAPVEVGGEGQGPTPVETLLSAVAGCSAMDVISILRKKKQVVTSYRVEVEWKRTPEGQWPRPITEIVIRHIVKGESLDVEAVRRSVELSDTKYCNVISTLRFSPSIVSEFVVE